MQRLIDWHARQADTKEQSINYLVGLFGEKAHRQGLTAQLSIDRSWHIKTVRALHQLKDSRFHGTISA
ncbi:MAG TPA: hypothetical protein DCP28_22360 [Cytophagales bacterium]|nr:hypothetical protein [Cytophagales bacterium]